MRKHTWLLLLVGALAGSLVTGVGAVSGTSAPPWAPLFTIVIGALLILAAVHFLGKLLSCCLPSSSSS
jgi:hypothetical protein